MKVQSFNSTGHNASGYNSSDNRKANYCTWTFNTGIGDSDRYIGPIQARVPIWGASPQNTIIIEGYASAGGGKYWSDTKQTYSGNSSHSDCWFAFDALSQERKKAILSNGVYVYSYRGWNDVTGSALITCQSWQGHIVPTGQNFTSGTIARYTKYRLRWTTDAEDDSERNNMQVWITISNENGTNSKTVKLANGALTYDLDTTQWSCLLYTSPSPRD